MEVIPMPSDDVSDNNAGHIRQVSAVLSTFPWTTDFLVKDISAIVTGDHYAEYIGSIAQVECVAAQSNDSNALRLQGALARVLPGSTSLPAPPIIRKPITHKVCEMVCAYRLIDALYDLQELKTPSSYHKPTYPKRRLTQFLPTKLWPLQDWVKLLNEAKSKIASLGFYKDSPSDETSALATTTPSLPLPLRLIRDLFSMSKHQEAIKLLHNFQIAALHLACMFKGAANMGDQLAIPNLPNEPTKWDTESLLTKEEAAFLQEFIRTTEIQKLRHALYGALLYSPLYLLTTRKLTGNAWDQERMLKLSKSLGNRKPAILVKVERLLWESLLAVATGKDTAYRAVNDFIQKVPWDGIDMVSDVDRSHFADDDSLPDDEVDLVSFFGEASLPESWPLAKFRSPVEGTPPGTSGGEGPPQSPSITPRGAPSNNQGGAMDVDWSAPGPNEPPSTPASGSEGPPSEGPKYKSERLRKLGKAGKVSNLSSSEVPRRRAKPPSSKKKPAVVKSVQLLKAKAHEFMPFQEVEEGIFIQQVRVKTFEELEDVTFDQEKTRGRIKGKQITLFSPSGQAYPWTPEFHFQTDLDTFNKLHSLVKRNYVHGKPRYISDPDASHIKVLAYQEYKAMSVKIIQTLLREQHLLITGFPTEQVVQIDQPVEFDEAGLQLLKNLEAHIQFQDQSIPVSDDYSVQLCTGTLEHLLQSARKEDGAILNALSFPLPLSEVRKSAFSSDVEAWRITEGLAYCDQEALYPSAEMKWGLAATAGARHWIHIDCDGLGTFIDCLHGKKLWCLFTPEEDAPLGTFGDTDQFFNKFDVTNPPMHWEAEAVLLEPGSRLIMKPNTPHAVFTTEHSIAVGGHFYSFANIQQTMFGLVHAFVMDSLVTNSEHPNTRVLLFRMLQYLYKFYVQGADPAKNIVSHLPALTHIDSIVDLLSLCNYCILSNVLDPRTYSFPELTHGAATATHLLQRRQHDYNALSPADRRYFSHVRGLAINLIDWVGCHLAFKDENDKTYGVATLARAYLHQQVRAILQYKIRAEKEHVRGVANCTSQDLRCQIELLFADCTDDLGEISLEELKDEGSTLNWEPDLRLVKFSNPRGFKERKPLALGTTKGDKMFYQGSTRHFPLSNEASKEAYGEVGESDGSQY